jgi:hypothetical protein
MSVKACKDKIQKCKIKIEFYLVLTDILFSASVAVGKLTNNLGLKLIRPLEFSACI